MRLFTSSCMYVLDVVERGPKEQVKQTKHYLTIDGVERAEVLMCVSESC